MGNPLYRKIIEGVVEQVFDDEGNCLSQTFISFEGKVDRRMVRDESAEIDESELEDDELIEHPDDIAELEARERFQETEMVQPVAPTPKPKPKKKK